MASIAVDKAAKTLRTDALKDLGVTIKDINLKCNACGEDYMIPLSRTPGIFTRTWFVCPKGCNSKAGQGGLIMEGKATQPKGG